MMLFPYSTLPPMSATQDLTLLLVRDAAEPEMWIDIWARSYPLVQQVSCVADEGIAQWQSKINTAWQLIPGRHGLAVPKQHAQPTTHSRHDFGLSPAICLHG